MVVRRLCLVMGRSHDLEASSQDSAETYRRRDAELVEERGGGKIAGQPCCLFDKLRRAILEC
jgi:hypothetical protein